MEVPSKHHWLLRADKHFRGRAQCPSECTDSKRGLRLLDAALRLLWLTAGVPTYTPCPCPFPCPYLCPRLCPYYIVSLQIHTTRILCRSDCPNDIARAGGTAATAIATCPRSCTASRHC